METRITATQLAKGLSDVLNRVLYRGERFVVERGGEPVATIAPVEPKQVETIKDLIELLRELPPPDEDFAADVQALRAAMLPLGEPR